MRTRGAIPDLLQDVGDIADLNGIGAETFVFSGSGALLAGALAGTTVALGMVRRRGGFVGAEGKGESILRKVGALSPVGTRADEFPLRSDVADLNTRVGRCAAVGAESAGAVTALLGGGFRGGGGKGRSGEGEESGGVLHFESKIGVILRIDSGVENVEDVN